MNSTLPKTLKSVTTRVYPAGETGKQRNRSPVALMLAGRSQVFICIACVSACKLARKLWLT
jgi:hypothetical protein